MDEHVIWSNSLENVLEDGSALEVFKEWFKEDSTRHFDSIDLYFAIKAFRSLVERDDPKCAEIACKIHRKYISMRSGTCTFLPDVVRKEMSERIHSLSSTRPPRTNLFDPCLDELLAYLRKQHAIFVTSEQFHDFVNRNAEMDEPSTAFLTDENAPAACLPGCRTCASTSTEAMVRPAARNSVWKRQHGSIRLKLPARRSAAVLNTSKRDSSVSCSGVSREESGNRRSGSRRHAEQRLPLQKVQGAQQHALLTCPPEGSDFKHQRPEERERFCEIVRCKLDKIASRLEQHKRETGIEIFARDLERLAVSAGDGNDETDSVISNDSLDKYEERMNNAECDVNPKEEGRRSMSASPVRFTSTLHVGNAPNPYGRHGFAPPPGGVSLNTFHCTTDREGLHSLRSTTPLSSTEYGGYRYSDSSGFCSSESANIVNRAALFEKARHMAMSAQTSSFPQSCSEASTSSFYYRSFPPERHQQPLFVDNFNSNLYQPTKPQQLTVSYKEENAEAPFVAKLEMRDVTFRDFRRCFGISSRTTKRFLFKSDCEDGSAPYQWTIIDDDCTVIPVFDGRITAECRNCSESD